MTPLMYAVKDNRSALLDRMIELGADVSARNNASSSLLIHDESTQISSIDGASDGASWSSI